MHQPITGLARVLVLGILSAFVGSTGVFAVSAMSIGPSYPDWVVSTPNVAAQKLARRDKLTQIFLAMEGEVLGETDSGSSTGSVPLPPPGGMQPGMDFVTGPDMNQPPSPEMGGLSDGPSQPNDRQPRMERQPMGSQQGTDRGAFGQGNMGPGDQQGPNEEEMDAKRAEMEKKALANMKKSFVRVTKDLASIEKRFVALQKKGATLTEECSSALSSAKGIVAGVQTAETMEAAQDAGIEELRDQFDTLNDCRQTMERLAQLPKILKRVDSEIKKAETRWNRAKKSAKDLAEIVAEGGKVIQDMKDARNSVTEAAKVGDMDTVEATIEDNIFGRMDDLDAVIQKISAVKQTKQFIAQFTRRMSDAKRLVAKLKKAGHDTSKLEDFIAQLTAKRAELKTFKAGSEEYNSAVEDMANLGQDFAEEAGTAEDIGGPLNAGGGGQNLSLPAGL